MSSDSPGKRLYQAIEERSKILVPQQIVILMHGLNIIRCKVSLQEQGIGHHSTVFVLPVMGEGGGRTRLGTHLETGKIRREGGREGEGSEGERKKGRGWGREGREEGVRKGGLNKMLPCKHPGTVNP